MIEPRKYLVLAPALLWLLVDYLILDAVANDVESFNHIRQQIASSTSTHSRRGEQQRRASGRRAVLPRADDLDDTVAAQSVARLLLPHGVTGGQRMLNPLFGAQLPRTRARLCSFDLTSTPTSYGVAVSCARARPVAISARRLCRRCQLDGHLRVRTATAGTPAA